MNIKINEGSVGGGGLKGDDTTFTGLRPIHLLVATKTLN